MNSHAWLNRIDLVKLVMKGQDAILAVCDASQAISDTPHQPWRCTWVVRGQLETPADVAYWLDKNAIYPEHAFHEAESLECAL